RTDRRADTDDESGEHPGAQLVPRVADLGAEENTTGIGVDAGADGGDLAVEHETGKGAQPDLYLLSEAKRRTVGLRHVGEHPHGVDVGDGIRRWRIARLHE